jgi:hypothetical protein
MESIFEVVGACYAVSLIVVGAWLMGALAVTRRAAPAEHLLPIYLAETQGGCARERPAVAAPQAAFLPLVALDGVLDLAAAHSRQPMPVGGGN